MIATSAAIKLYEVTSKASSDCPVILKGRLGFCSKDIFSRHDHPPLWISGLTLTNETEVVWMICSIDVPTSWLDNEVHILSWKKITPHACILSDSLSYLEVEEMCLANVRKSNDAEYHIQQLAYTEHSRFGRRSESDNHANANVIAKSPIITTKGSHFFMVEIESPTLSRSTLVVKSDFLISWHAFLQVGSCYLFPPLKVDKIGSSSRVVLTPSNTNKVVFPERKCLQHNCVDCPRGKREAVMTVSDIKAIVYRQLPDLRSLHYIGVISHVRVLGIEGLYRLDKKHKLFMQLFPCSSLGAGLRVGARIEIQNVHPLYFWGKFEGFGLCLRSSYKVLEFSKNSDAPYVPLYFNKLEQDIGKMLWQYQLRTAIVSNLDLSPVQRPFENWLFQLFQDNTAGSNCACYTANSRHKRRQVYDEFMKHHGDTCPIERHTLPDSNKQCKCENDSDSKWPILPTFLEVLGNATRETNKILSSHHQRFMQSNENERIFGLKLQFLRMPLFQIFQRSCALIGWIGISLLKLNSNKYIQLSLNDATQRIMFTLTYKGVVVDLEIQQDISELRERNHDGIQTVKVLDQTSRSVLCTLRAGCSLHDAQLRSIAFIHGNADIFSEVSLHNLDSNENCHDMEEWCIVRQSMIVPFEAFRAYSYGESVSENVSMPTERCMKYSNANVEDGAKIFEEAEISSCSEYANVRSILKVTMNSSGRPQLNEHYAKQLLNVVGLVKSVSLIKRSSTYSQNGTALNSHGVDQVYLVLKDLIYEDVVSVYIDIGKNGWPVGLIPGLAVVELKNVARKLSKNLRSIYLSMRGAGTMKVMYICRPQVMYESFCQSCYSKEPSFSMWDMIPRGILPSKMLNLFKGHSDVRHYTCIADMILPNTLDFSIHWLSVIVTSIVSVKVYKEVFFTAHVERVRWETILLVQDGTGSCTLLIDGTCVPTVLGLTSSDIQIVERCALQHAHRVYEWKQSQSNIHNCTHDELDIKVIELLATRAKTKVFGQRFEIQASQVLRFRKNRLDNDCWLRTVDTGQMEFRTISHQNLKLKVSSVERSDLQSSQLARRETFRILERLEKKIVVQAHVANLKCI